MTLARLLTPVAALAVVAAAAVAQDGSDILTMPLDQLPPDNYDLQDPFADEPRATMPPDEPVPDSAFPDDAAAAEPPVDAGPEPSMIAGTGARLRGLDTLTNTVNDFEIAVGETLAFKRLIVTLEACRYPEGNRSGEAYAFLRIQDRRDEAPQFSGWMLASSPALSALDHPRYDVWVLRCLDAG